MLVNIWYHLDIHCCLPILHQHLCSSYLPGAAGPAVAQQHLSVACQLPPVRRISVRYDMTHAIVDLAQQRSAAAGHRQSMPEALQRPDASDATQWQHQTSHHCSMCPTCRVGMLGGSNSPKPLTCAGEWSLCCPARSPWLLLSAEGK